jgi:hypothetical protein
MPALYKLLSLARVGAHFRPRDFSYFPLSAVFRARIYSAFHLSAAAAGRFGSAGKSRWELCFPRGKGLPNQPCETRSMRRLSQYLEFSRLARGLRGCAGVREGLGAAQSDRARRRPRPRGVGRARLQIVTSRRLIFSQRFAWSTSEAAGRAGDVAWQNRLGLFFL